MSCKNDDITIFRYNSFWGREKNKNKSNIDVLIVCNNGIDSSKYRELNEQLNKYLNDDSNYNLVDVVLNIKNIFKDFSTDKLSIKISGNDSIQEVDYVDGKMESCNFSIREWDDIITVGSDYRGVKIKYHKHNNKGREPKDIEAIYGDLSEYFKMIVELQELSKNNKVLRKQ